MVTITDIAQRAGVAKSTVSNALTGKKYVSEELKKRILDICEEMNYAPNFYASRLSGNRTNIVALFLEESESGVYHAYYTELIEACLKYLSKCGYNLLISYNSDKRMRNSLLQRGKAPVDGAIIMAPLVEDERILQFESDLIPCISIGKPNDAQSIGYVDIDNYKLVVDAVNLLADNGYKYIYLLNSNDTLTISRDRKKAFVEALESNELPIREDSVLFSVDSSFEEGERFALEHISKNTAFVTANVRLAEGVYSAADKKGLTIGHDVGVFALGGQRNEKITPNLAYATQDYAKLAKMAAKNLISQLSSDEEGEPVKVENQLISSKICFDTSINRK